MGGEVILKKRTQRYCALILGFLLGVSGGRIALWEDGQAEPVKVFPYSVTMLPEADQRALESGIRAEDRAQLFRLLQDFLS